MAKTKLTELNVEEVSLVDAGANQHAHVTMFKAKNAQPGQGEQQAEKPQSGIRKLFSAIGKALSIPSEDIESAVADIEKADTFGRKMEQRKLSRITDEIWDVCYALESSLCSIIRDEEVTDKAGLMNQSIDEFTTTIKALTASWGAGTPAQIAKNAIPAEHLQETAARLEELITKAGSVGAEPTDGEGASGEGGEVPPEPEETKKTKEGGNIDMKFNEANMTPADRLAFEHLKKNYGIAEDGDGAQAGAAGAEGAAGTEGVEKNAGAANVPAQAAEGTQAGAENTPAAGEDIYKGMNPAVAAMLKSLQERVEKAEEKEMLEVAKGYEIIGQDPQTLAKSLASAKAAGGTAYADMIGVLDSAKAMK